MVDVDVALARYNAGRPQAARMILTVHDELVFEVPTDTADSVADLVRTAMERAVPLDVPLTVDVGIGANWTAAKH
jgi:DNA polymerase-1